MSVTVVNPEDKSDILYYEAIPAVVGFTLRGSKKEITQRVIEWARTNGHEVDESHITFSKREKLPDEVFFNVDTTAMAQIINQAARRAESERRGILPEAEAWNEQRLSSEINKVMFRAISDVVKLRGFGAHTVARKGTPGYETQDVKRVLLDYVIGANGMLKKMELAKDLRNIMHGEEDGRPIFDARRDSEEFRFARNYVKDILTNKDHIDTAVDNFRGLLFMKYLGLVIKTATLNLTQNMVAAWPRLSILDIGDGEPIVAKNAGRVLAKSMKDLRKAITDIKHTGKYLESKNLTENEAIMLQEMIESGINMDQFLTELRGASRMQNPVLNKTMGIMGLPMQMAEKFNRGATSLAAYRIATEHLKDSGLSKTEIHKRASTHAENVVLDSHYLYGKANYPEFIRGSSAAKLIRPLYTFRTFTHNYAEMINWMLRQGWVGQQAAGKSLGSIFALGGLLALPFYDTWDDWYKKIFGETPATHARKKIDNDLFRDLITFGGLGALGIDLHGSLGIELPKSFVDILGVPWALVEDTKRFTTDIKMGQYLRALEDSPITPMVVRNAMSGYRQFEKGTYTRTGRPIGDITGGKEEPRKLGPKDFIMKSLLGFQPVSSSKAFEAYNDLSKKVEEFNDVKRGLATKFVEYRRKGNRKGMANIRKRVLEWNRKARREGQPEMIINLTRMIKTRETARKPPTAFRREARALQDVWR